MDIKLEARFLIELCADLSALSGGGFEVVARRILESHHPSDWKHNGTTKEGAPRGYVVDSVGDNGELVAEYSTAAGYFDTLTKPKKDIRHARTKHSNVKRVFLFSNRECPATTLTKVETLKATEAARVKPLALEVVDGMGLAKLIVKHIHDDRLFDSIGNHLPSLRRLREEWASTGMVPGYDRYIRRPESELRVQTALETNRVVWLAGLSGSGKSALCSHIAREFSAKVNNVIWLNASGLKSVDELRAWDVRRSGHLTNVLNLVRSVPSLLVLDDVSVQNLGELEGEVGSQSKVLITSQFTSRGCVELESLTADEASQILGADCPHELKERVWKSSAGQHPLTLGVLRGLGDEQGWEVVAEVLDDAVQLDDATNTRIFERVLDRHAAHVTRELQFVSFCGVGRIDIALLKKVCGTPSVLALERRQLATRDDVGALHVHDVVMACVLKKFATKDEDFVGDVEAFVAAAMRTDDLVLQGAARLHAPLFERLLRSGVGGSASRYAFAVARPLADATSDPLGNPVELAKNVCDYKLDVYAVLETIEARYTRSRVISIDDAKLRLRSDLAAFDLLLDHPLSNETARDVKHHKAKAHQKLGDIELSTALCHEIIALYGLSPETQLLLAKTLKKPAKDLQIEKLLDQADASPESVSTTVVLAAFTEANDAKIAVKYRKVLFEHLRKALKISYDQPYQVVARLGNLLWYTDPEFLADLVAILPSRLHVPDSDDAKYNWAQTQKFAARAVPSKQVAYERGAEFTYASIEAPKSIHLTQWSDLLIRQARGDEAIALLERPECKRDMYWFQRMGQAVRFTDPARAEELFGSAMDAKQEGGERFLSAIYRDRSRAREDQGNTQGALADLQHAIGICKDDKFLRELEDDLARLKAAK